MITGTAPAAEVGTDDTVKELLEIFAEQDRQEAVERAKRGGKAHFARRLDTKEYTDARQPPVLRHQPWR